MTLPLNLFGVLTFAVVAAHMLFVAFAALGALLALRWRWIPWLQIPAAAWATYVEMSGGLCPLTTLENTLRQRAGLASDANDFVERYLLPLLYPEGLTRDIQLLLGLVVAGINIAVYAWLLRRRRQRT